MNVLILGAGGREHALAWKIAQSPKCKKLFVAPGNSGTSELATNIAISTTDFEKIKLVALKYQIDMLIVGPEDPLVEGVHDFFLSDNQLRHVHVIGPQKEGAKLEGSKEYAKEFMYKHGIPTARYRSFTQDTLQEGLQFLNTFSPPYVLKADGLAAGKGVLVLDDLQEARAELEKMLLEEKFGQASRKVVIEEFMEGVELSCFVLTDGNHYQILPYAKDYKRIGENDTGLNTGGMGAISPVPFADEEFLSKIEEQVVKPTINGLKKDKIPYQGFLFIGLMKVGDEPRVVEYNVRMGDPETEVVMPRIKSDLLEALCLMADGKLNQYDLKVDQRIAATVMIVSGGYPKAYEKDKIITGSNEVKDSILFHAGCQWDAKGNLRSQGGRVLAVTSYGSTLKRALQTSYRNVEKIHFDKKYFRKDIGFDLQKWMSSNPLILFIAVIENFELSHPINKGSYTDNNKNPRNGVSCPPITQLQGS